MPWMPVREAEKAMRSRRYRRWFRNLWEANADEYEFFELARAINPGMTFPEFDLGWQHCVVLHPDLSQAVREFTIVLFGGF